MFKNKYFHLQRLMGNERRSQDELINIQTTKLRRLITHAYENVKFYRDIFQGIGLHPEDIKSVDDIHKIPIIDKNDFHQRPSSDLLDKRIKDKDRLVPINTSGSSGLSLRFYIDYDYDQFRKAQYLRPYLTNGRRPWDKVFRLSNTDVPKKKWFQRLSLLAEYNIYPDSNLEHQINLINKLKPTIIQGFGSCLALLASKIVQENISITAPRVVFTGSELLTKQIRTTIARGFNAEVVDVYGTFETDNVAYECSKHEGYHITSDCVIMEFLKDGEKINAGEEGEIVCTVLDNFTMPFIRYNLHDLGSYADKQCSCERTFPLMDIIGGRSDDYAVYGNGLTKSPRNFLGLFDPLAKFLYEYQVIQEDIYKFTVQVVPNKNYDRKIERTIRENLQKEFPEAQIDIKVFDKIEREQSGKFRAFISKVKNKTVIDK